ncbi:MAG: hypothetical protein GX455_06600 [Phycisphaerae bacterium]|nr:hypothetical protein [Phycisphaerae bacterium]
MRRTRIIGIGVIVLVLLAWLILETKRIHDRALCNGQLKAIETALRVYFEEYDRLPEYDQWYDQLIKVTDNVPEAFLCPAGNHSDKKGHYVLNQNFPIRWDGPIDMVLVFEGDEGWNQFGDETKWKSRHRNGANVLFSDGEVYFVKTEDAKKLRWK